MREEGMLSFRSPDQKEVASINRLQRERFDKLVHMFEPPLPEGVPERLARIVAAANIREGDTVLDVGTGTGILVPLIQKHRPEKIYACDLSLKMLAQLKRNYTGVNTIHADVRDVDLPDATVDVVFINACYPNIADKDGTFWKLSRMMKPSGRAVISHPLGKRFVEVLRKTWPFALDDFPERAEAGKLFAPYGMTVSLIVDKPDLYILVIRNTG
jgi:SAM-dependent methyltransferase